MTGDTLIFGAGHLGRQVVHHLRHYSKANVVGFVDDTKGVGEQVANGLCNLGGIEDVAGQPELGPEHVKVVFAIGYADMKARMAALDRVLECGYALLSIVHPRSMIEPGARLGQGAIVLAGAVIDQGVVVGDACYVDIGVRIGEDSVAGRNNYFSSGAAVGGAVQIGDSNFFGMDCTVTTGVRIGSDCFINAKALIARNLGSNVKHVEMRKSKQLPH